MGVASVTTDLDGGAPTSVLPLLQPAPSQGEEAPLPLADVFLPLSR